jgi:8-oxo-dGTP pyrophosphatase MutT (NUDIX family)
MSTTLPRLFIGCARESVNVAEALQYNLQHHADVRIWNQNLLITGSTTLEDLLNLAPTFDFAVFIWSPDDMVTSRNITYFSPRDNVVLEAGLFYGVLGRARVFLLLPETPPSKVPSDLLGINQVHYRPPLDENFPAALGPASTLLKERLLKLGSRSQTPTTSGLTPSLFRNLEEAARAASADCATAETIAILCNRGLVFFGTDESIVSLAQIDRYASLRKIRILLMNDSSPWLSAGFFRFRAYVSPEIFRKELRACHEIVEAAMSRIARRLPSAKSGVRYYSGEPKFRLVLTDKVAYVTSYADLSRLQVRDLPVYRFTNATGSLYGALKRHFDDLWHNHSNPGSYQLEHLDLETSAGGIVIASRGHAKFVVLLRRHDGYWVLPKGHRKKEDENIEQTALREVCEETGLSPDVIQIERNLGDYTYDETAQSHDSTKIVYLFLMRCKSAITPNLCARDHEEARWWPIGDPLPEMLYTYQKTFLHEVLLLEAKSTAP